MGTCRDPPPPSCQPSSFRRAGRCRGSVVASAAQPRTGLLRPCPAKDATALTEIGLRKGPGPCQGDSARQLLGRATRLRSAGRHRAACQRRGTGAARPRRTRRVIRRIRQVIIWFGY